MTDFAALIVVDVIGAALAGTSIFNALRAAGTDGLQELAWVLGAVAGASVIAASHGLVTL